MANKQLKRSNDKMVGGVAAGIAEYIGVDPVLVRLAFALLILSHIPLGLVIYFLLMLIMPENSDDPVKSSASPLVEEDIIIHEA